MLQVVSLGERDVRIGTFTALSLWEGFLQSNKLPVDVSVVQSLLTRAQLSISKLEITFAGFISRSSRDDALSIFLIFFLDFNWGQYKGPIPSMNSEMHAHLWGFLIKKILERNFGNEWVKPDVEGVDLLA